MPITESHFRILFHRMLEPKPSRFHISSGEDKWGLVVTRTAITGVQVWYAADKGMLTLGITTEEMRAKVPDGVKPQGSYADPSHSGWLQFRWQVPELDLTEPPQAQIGTKVVLDRINFAFDWFKNVRSDL